MLCRAAAFLLIVLRRPASSCSRKLNVLRSMVITYLRVRGNSHLVSAAEQGLLLQWPSLHDCAAISTSAEVLARGYKPVQDLSS